MSTENLLLEMIKDTAPERVTRLERILIAFIGRVDLDTLDDRKVRSLYTLSCTLDAMFCTEGQRQANILSGVYGEYVKGVGPEPQPDELPIFDDRRIIMTRAQLNKAILATVQKNSLWHRSGLTDDQYTGVIIKGLLEYVREFHE